MTESNTDIQPCPCGSGQPYPDCCGPYHTGQRLPPTAEALMRSRYSAYVLRDGAYLLDSWHPSTRPAPESLQPLEAVDWSGLEILHTGAGGTAIEAFIEFRARYRAGGQDLALHENSRFLRDQGRWQYVDGQLDPGSRAAAAKPGRNQPCPCGSGRKYKHCCGR